MSSTEHRNGARPRVPLAIIGPGLIWSVRHREVLAVLGDRFRVVAVCGRSDESARRATEAYPEAGFYRDIAALLDDERVEAVAAFTPIPLNAPTARQILASGRHAIVEKPVARSVAEAYDLYESEAASRGRLYVLEQFAYLPLVDRLAELLARRAIGTPVSYELSAHMRIGADDDQTGGFGATEWRVTPNFPLGVFFDAGIHQFAMLQALFGVPRRVYARGRNLREGYGAYDIVTTLMEYENGLIGTVTFSTVLGRQGRHFVVRGSEAALDCSEANGITHIDASSGASRHEPMDGRDETELLWRDIHESICTGGSVRYERTHALGDLRVLEAIERSLESAVPVEVLQP